MPKLDLGGVHDQPNVTEVHLPRLTGPGEAHSVPLYAQDVVSRTPTDPRIQEFNDRLARTSPAGTTSSPTSTTSEGTDA
ncbi:hypothetical protein G7085_12505 [Tessaracoccus sp. HDW20]|uniref:hypothetical protein n=1 Tax=Tessaracoccus coleopterorum TaxID=2714950 RepID=UPI0018D3BC7E|nr:hypothetical protein [Tessaracoccus coleopterorum]NHB85166.1 hypothetical protein [Tessaracoccus coleopterorum]